MVASDNEKPDLHLSVSITKYRWTQSDGGFPHVAACYRTLASASNAAFDDISRHFEINPCASSLLAIQTMLTSPACHSLPRSIEFWKHPALGWHANYPRKTHFRSCPTCWNTSQSNIWMESFSFAVMPIISVTKVWKFGVNDCAYQLFHQHFQEPLSPCGFKKC